MHITTKNDWLPEEWCRNTLNGSEGIASKESDTHAVRIDGNAVWVSGKSLADALHKAAIFRLHYARVNRIERPTVALEYAKDALEYAAAASVELRSTVDEVSEARALIDACVDVFISRHL